jgi:hypothetical protein
MIQDRNAFLDSTIDRLLELLPYVARDSERFRSSTELVSKSLELHLAARAIDETLPHPSLAAGVPVIRVRMGAKAVEAVSMRRNAYDLLEIELESSEPSSEYDLRYKYNVRTDLFNPAEIHTKPVYGQHLYFDLPVLARTLEDGGELFVSE